MTREQVDRLYALYTTARDAWGKAERSPGNWREAFAADRAFTDALLDAEVTE